MFKPIAHAWSNPHPLPSRHFVCGYCANKIASNEGWFGATAGGREQIFLYICHLCCGPNLLDEHDLQVPAPLAGDPVPNLPEKVEAVYEEARRAYSSNAPTGCVALLRTLLIHIAADKGAAPGCTFQQAISHLADAGAIPEASREWVDLIRQDGNATQHDLRVFTLQEASETLELAQMVLANVYYFPSKVEARRKAKEKKAADAQRAAEVAKEHARKLEETAKASKEMMDATMKILALAGPKLRMKK